MLEGAICKVSTRKRSGFCEKFCVEHLGCLQVGQVESLDRRMDIT